MDDPSHGNDAAMSTEHMHPDASCPDGGLAGADSVLPFQRPESEVPAKRHKAHGGDLGDDAGDAPGGVPEQNSIAQPDLTVVAADVVAAQPPCVTGDPSMHGAGTQPQGSSSSALANDGIAGLELLEASQGLLTQLHRDLPRALQGLKKRGGQAHHEATTALEQAWAQVQQARTLLQRLHDLLPTPPSAGDTAANAAAAGATSDALAGTGQQAGTAEVSAQLLRERDAALAEVAALREHILQQAQALAQSQGENEMLQALLQDPGPSAASGSGGANAAGPQADPTTGTTTAAPDRGPQQSDQQQQQAPGAQLAQTELLESMRVVCREAGRRLLAARQTLTSLQTQLAQATAAAAAADALSQTKLNAVESELQSMRMLCRQLQGQGQGRRQLPPQPRAGGPIVQSLQQQQQQQQHAQHLTQQANTAQHPGSGPTSTLVQLQMQMAPPQMQAGQMQQRQGSPQLVTLQAAPNTTQHHTHAHTLSIGPPGMGTVQLAGLGGGAQFVIGPGGQLMQLMPAPTTMLTAMPQGVGAAPAGGGVGLPLPMMGGHHPGMGYTTTLLTTEGGGGGGGGIGTGAVEFVASGDVLNATGNIVVLPYR